jgi:hypothetical protein
MLKLLRDERSGCGHDEANRGWRSRVYPPRSPRSALQQRGEVVERPVTLAAHHFGHRVVDTFN